MQITPQTLETVRTHRETQRRVHETSMAGMNWDALERKALAKYVTKFDDRQVPAPSVSPELSAVR